MAGQKKKSCLSVMLWIIGGLVGLCLLLTGISALVNVWMPQRSTVVDRLTPADLARLTEAEHLRRTLGGQALPGWDQADIPLIVFNEHYAFLTGYPDPPAGWRKVPRDTPVGGSWEPVAGEPAYYRLKLPDAKTSPQNFTVRVGDAWAASLSTLEWFRIGVAAPIRELLPGMLKPIFPYPLFARVLMSSSDQYMTSILHEAAHAYQGIKAPDKLSLGEYTFDNRWQQYPREEKSFTDAWAAELISLHDGLQAKTDAEARQYAAQFLQRRQVRRETAKLSQDLVEMERAREWEEGLAKYAEMRIYRLAATTPGYQPAEAVLKDPEFQGYRTFDWRWNNEVDQIVRSASQGDGCFYYAGMAQGFLLDRLMPEWKARIFDQDTWLEDLLADAVR